MLRNIIPLTNWGRMTHIYVSEQTNIGSDNDLSPYRRQAIIWTNAGILLIGPIRRYFSEFFNHNTYIFSQGNALQNIVCKVASILSRPLCVKLVWSNISLQKIYFRYIVILMKTLLFAVLRWGSEAKYVRSLNVNERAVACMMDGFCFLSKEVWSVF